MLIDCEESVVMRVHVLPMFDRIAGNHELLSFTL